MRQVHAYEKDLEFSGAQGHAVVVEFGQPWRFVFWDRAQYVGCVDLGHDVWFTSEWCETNSPNDLHCYEPIMDKQLRWSRVEILESGPARARVRWTYALCDMRYRIFHGNTRAEEIYTIYPDGIAVREIALWPGTESNHGGNANLWQVAEWILINGAGSNPLDCLQMPTPFTLRNGAGETVEVPWPLPAANFEPFCAHYPQVADWPMYVGRISLKGQPNPFIIICKNQALFPYQPCAHCGGDHPYFNIFPGRNLHNIYKHWPVTQMEDFIQWVPAGDDVGRVATHTSFMDVNYAMRRGKADPHVHYTRRRSDVNLVPTPDPGTTWYLLVGATGEETEGRELEALGHAYQFPAKIDVIRDPGEPEELHRGRVLLEGYDYALRATTFRKRGADRMAFTMKPTAPQINPVFVVNGWTSPEVTLTIDGQPVDAAGYRAQMAGDDLVVWVAGTFAHPTEVRIEAASPA